MDLAGDSQEGVSGWYHVRCKISEAEVQKLRISKLFQCGSRKYVTAFL